MKMSKAAERTETTVLRGQNARQRVLLINKNAEIRWLRGQIRAIHARLGHILAAGYYNQKR